jgi:hypothetical protein
MFKNVFCKPHQSETTKTFKILEMNYKQINPFPELFRFLLGQV